MALQAMGRRFESDHLHQYFNAIIEFSVYLQASCVACFTSHTPPHIKVIGVIAIEYNLYLTRVVGADAPIFCARLRSCDIIPCIF